MYDEIHAQPEAARRSLSLFEAHGRQVARVVAGARRVLTTGCGTSFHAAELGAWFLRTMSAGKIEAHAIEAFDLTAYFPGLRPDDVILAVSHSGETTMTIQSMQRAHRSGAETVLVTGFPESAGAKLARYILPTGYTEERSWAHTASYTAALVSLASLATALAEPHERLDLSPLPDVLLDVLELEELTHRVAASAVVAQHENPGARIMLVGAGPNAVTAQEAELKLLETSYASAAAFQLEEMLHGPLASVSEDTLVFVAAPAGSATGRTLELIRAVRRLGTTPVVLADGDNAPAFEDAHVLLMPELPEIISPIAHVVPFQLLSYFLAVDKRINPDLLRRDDERYRAARAQYW